MVKIKVTNEFKKLFREIDVKIQKKAAIKAELFRENPFNPILETEKLNPKHHKVWSFRVDQRYRIIFKFIGKGIVEFRFIGHHNKIYKYNIFSNSTKLAD